MGYNIFDGKNSSNKFEIKIVDKKGIGRGLGLWGAVVCGARVADGAQGMRHVRSHAITVSYLS